MLSKFGIALSLAVVLGTASAALAATKHPVHHHWVAKRQLSGAGAYGYSSSFGYSSSVTCPSGACDPYNHQQVKCIGGACDPEWGINTSE
jgi:hypothetical protein